MVARGKQLLHLHVADVLPDLGMHFLGQAPDCSIARSILRAAYCLCVRQRPPFRHLLIHVAPERAAVALDSGRVDNNLGAAGHRQAT